MMRRSLGGVAIGAVLVAITGPALAQDGAQAPERPAPLIRDAGEAMRDGAGDDAMVTYDRLRDLDPTRAAFPFNQAIAHYRKGEFDRAADLFKEAAAAPLP